MWLFLFFSVLIFVRPEGRNGMEWYLQLVFHILHTFVLNVQLLRFTVRNIEHIENNRKKSTKSTQTVRMIVLNEQTDIMTNTQTYFVKFLCIIINFDTEGHCSLHCRQEAIFHQAGSTPVSQDHSTIYNDDSWLQT